MSAALRFEIPKGTPASKCGGARGNGCGEFIYWIKTPSGKNMPVNADGTSHFANCPKAGDFRKRGHVVIVALAKFKPLLTDLREHLDEIAEANDDDHNFIQRLLLEMEDGKLVQITQPQYDRLERLHGEYCA